MARPDLKTLFITGYAENAMAGSGHFEPGMRVLTEPFVMEAPAPEPASLVRTARHERAALLTRPSEAGFSLGSALFR